MKVKSFNEFISESMWNDIRKRGIGSEIKKEEGKFVGTLEDGTSLIIGNSEITDGELVQFDGEHILKFGDGLYVALISNGKMDTYYALDGGKDLNDGDGNMTMCFETDCELRTKHNFKPLKALIEDDEWDDDKFYDLNVVVRSDWVEFYTSDFKYRVYFDKTFVLEYAIEKEVDALYASETTRDDIDEWESLYGDEIFDDEHKVDLEKVAKLIIQDKGPEEILSFDGLERNRVVDGTEYYIYRVD